MEKYIEGLTLKQMMIIMTILAIAACFADNIFN